MNTTEATVEYSCRNLIVTNKDEILQELNNDFGYLTNDTLKDMLDCMINNIRISMKEEPENNSGVVSFDSEEADKFEKDWNKFLDSKRPAINIIDYITEDEIIRFKQCMLNGLYDLTTRERIKNGQSSIPNNWLRVSCCYRASYSEYGRLYKEIKNDYRYNTDEKDLLSMFFLNHIFNRNEAYHMQKDIKIPFLKTPGEDNYLLTEKRYKGLLMGNIKNCLLENLYKQYPDYVFTKSDRYKLIEFFQLRLYRP